MVVLLEPDAAMRARLFLLVVVVVALLLPARAEAAVKLERFEAWLWMPGPPGVVRIEWTAIEHDNFEWMLWRWEGANQPVEPFCSWRACQRNPCSYPCLDIPYVVGVQYWLTDKDTQGRVTWHGPVVPEEPASQ